MTKIEKYIFYEISKGSLLVLFIFLSISWLLQFTRLISLTNLIQVDIFTIFYLSTFLIPNIITVIIPFVIMFGFVIFVLFMTMNIPSTNVIAKHLSWLLLVFLLSIVFYPSYYISRETNLFYSTLLTVGAMMSILTIIAFWKPEWISLSWGPVLLVALVSAIVLHVLLLLSGQSWEKGGIAKWLAWGLVFLFSLFILYDTKRMQVLAKECKGHPDYVNHSLAFLIDLINLFTSLLRGNLLD